MRIFVVLLVAALAAGCSKKSQPAPAAPAPAPAAAKAPEKAPPAQVSDAELETTMQRTLKVIQQLGQAVADNAADCGKMATAVEQVVASNQSVLADAKRFEQDPSFKQRADAWMSQHENELNAVMEKLGPGMTACGADPRVEAAFKKLEEA